MFKPKEMSRAIIVGHKDVMEDTVNALHDINTFHIENFEEDDSGFKIGRSFQNAGDLSHKLVKLRSISSFLGLKPQEQNKQNVEDLLKDLDSKLLELENVVAEKNSHKNRLENQSKELETLKKDIIPFSGFSLDLGLYRGYKNITVITGSVKEDVTVAVAEVTQSYEIEQDLEIGTVVLFIRNEDRDKVLKVLSNFKFQELRVPDVDGIPNLLLANIEMEESEINTEIVSLEVEITKLKEKYSEFILASEEILSIESEKSEAPLRIATSEQTFVIDGWIPDDHYELLTNTVDNATNGRGFVSKQEVTKEETNIIPIEYDNPKVSKPLEAIMDLYARPRYTEIDPTFLIFITFPLFYGLMLGDLGYASTLLLIALGLKKYVKIEALKPFFNVMIYCQIVSLVFGVLYGEIFGFSLASMHTAHGITAGLIPGFETIELFHSPIGNEVITFPVHRTHLAMTMLALRVVIGVIHVNIGYLLGFINENRNHGIVSAMFEKGSWVIIEIAIGLLVLGYLEYIPMAAGIVVFIIGFIMLVKGEGIAGPLELPTLLSNTLSYTRLAAVGLSSVYIASTVNLLAFERIMPDEFGIMTIFALIVFFIGHLINTILSIVAPGLHSLRLQYVEFFTKFYEGGGRKYNPFGYIRKYTEE